MPIEGRSGITQNPELVIAVLISVVGLLMFGLIVPLFAMSIWPIWKSKVFLIIFLISVIIMVTPVGFPYRESVSAQRIEIYVRSIIL